MRWWRRWGGEDSHDDDDDGGGADGDYGDDGLAVAVERSVAKVKHPSRQRQECSKTQLIFPICIRARKGRAPGTTEVHQPWTLFA